jgi:rubrerythrin
MSPLAFIRRTFFRSLVATPEGRAHVLSLMVAAEEGDEAGVFDRLIEHMDDEKLKRIIAAHQADETRHAHLYRACLERNGLSEERVPDGLMVIRTIARTAGGVFEANDANGIASREDVMNTYALLMVIEERGVEQFPIIGEEFRRIGDHATADTFDRVTSDERRHVKSCRKLGRRYAPDEATWERAVARFRKVEKQAFGRVGVAGLAYAWNRGLVFRGLVQMMRGKNRPPTPRGAREPDRSPREATSASMTRISRVE